MLFSFFKNKFKNQDSKDKKPENSARNQKISTTAIATGKNDTSLPDLSETKEEKPDHGEESLDNLVFEYSFADSPIYKRYLEWFSQRRVKDKGDPLTVFQFLDYYLSFVKDDPLFKDYTVDDSIALLNEINDYIHQIFEENLDNENFVEEDPILWLKATEDNLAAYVFVFPHVKKGKAVNIDLIKEHLSVYGIEKGIDEKAIKRMINRKDYFTIQKVAGGTVPVDGKDGEVIEHYPRKIKIVFKEDEFGNTDFKNFGNVQNITKGSVICDIINPTEGVDGVDIYGNVLEAKDGEMPIIPMGENTVLSEDETKLLAASDGCVNYHDGMFYVRQLLYIKGNVGPHTGNINFKGDVHVEGDVRDGYDITADGSIKVQGTVENSSLTAGGGISISGGVKGNEKAVLTAGSEIKSLFFENCTVKSKNGVYSESIINSNIYTDEDISVDRGKGSIIGGTLVARTYVQAKIIGNQTGKSCYIKLGTNYNVAQEKANLIKEINELEDSLRQTKKDLLFHERGSLAANTEKHKQYLALKAKAGMIANQIRIKQKKLNDIIANGFDIGNCYMRAKEVFPPINITIGTHNTIIRMPYFSAKCYYSPKKEEFRIVNFSDDMKDDEKDSEKK